MYKLYNGDCLEVMKQLKDKSIDAIITDIPYGTTQCSWDSVIPFEPMWEQLNRIIKDNGAICLFGSEPFSSALRMSNIKNYKYNWKWNKENGGNPLNAKYIPMQIFEDVCIFGNGRINYYPIMENANKNNIRPLSISKQKTDLIGKIKQFQSDENYKIDKRYPKNELIFSNRKKECNPLNRLHPTQKPIDLMVYLIKTYTNENDTVLDFTMGSGSTGVACINTKRDFIGIELEKKYYDIAEKRIKEADTSIFDI